MSNLIGNAIKYTHVGGSVFVTLADTPDGRILISVKDTGIGISEEDSKKVFDRFFQASGNMGGTGIGLAVVKAYTELHHGEATVKSKIGEGSDFRIIIPCSQEGFATADTPDDSNAPAPTTIDCIDDSNALSAGHAAGNAAAVPSADSDKPKLLVIDDNIDIREYIRTTFAGEYDIMESDNGREGLEMAIKYVPDIVVSDVMMPQMNGMDFCSALKQNPATCHIPVILLTAKVLDDQKIEGYEHGADSYITKPFNSKILRARIENLINSRRMTDITGSAATALTNATVSKEAAPAGTADKADTAAEINDTDRKFITQLHRIVEENLTDTDFGVEEISGEVGLSRVQLYRKVKAITGMTVVDLLRKARLNRAKTLLAETDKSISEIAYEVGFSSPSYFTKCYKDEYKILPVDVRNAKQTAEKG